jgi:putative transposase
MMQERGVFFDHATVHRWAIKILQVLATVLRRRKRPVGKSWRMDETYIKLAGQWKYLYRAVDRDGDTIDFLLRAKRDWAAARKFRERSIALHGEPDKITIDKSGANTATIASYNAGHEAAIELRQSKYLNNIVEQDHRAIKRIVRPMLGFKTFRCASILIAGIETMHMIRKGQLDCPAGQASSAASQFCSLAVWAVAYPATSLQLHWLIATEPGEFVEYDPETFEDRLLDIRRSGRPWYSDLLIRSRHHGGSKDAITRAPATLRCASLKYRTPPSWV